MSKPTKPGIYMVSGYSIGRPKEWACVVVEMHDGELRCNLHESTSEERRDRWAWMDEMNSGFTWKRLAAHPTQKAKDGAAG